MHIQHLSDISVSTVSHHASIAKRVLVNTDVIPSLIQFAQATFPAGAVAHAHAHEDMAEVFFVQQGCGEININGQSFALKEGVVITVEARETHEITNTSDDDLILLYFGIKV